MQARAMVKLSVVIPVFNEGQNVPELYRRLKLSAQKVARQYEIIFVDDGSIDDSLNILKRLRSKDKKVKIISFSRNFGHMSAVAAGLNYSSGEKVVVMDADLQDPPELIPKMYEISNKGYDVVYGVKRKRKEAPIKRFLFTAFYRILNLISTYKMPLDSGTFSLINQRVVQVIVSLPEKNKYFSGVRAWAGFKQTGVRYSRESRFTGRPKTLRSLLGLAIVGFVSFSYLPLRLASILGFVCAGIAFLSIITVLLLRIFFEIGIVGWASTLSTILLVGGIQLIAIGIIGEYLARIYEEVKDRPEYVIRERLGFRRPKI